MPDPTTPLPPPITNKIRQDWNDYVDSLEKRKLKGHPMLDTNGLGYKVLDDYVKTTPGTSLNREMIPRIQQEFGNYRNYVLNLVKQGKAQLNGVKPEDFMATLSKVDGYPGQLTTSFKFPDSYLKTFNDGKLESVVNKGFAVANK